MKKFTKSIDRSLEIILSSLFLIMVAVTSWQVITRYILNNPSSVTEEFVKFSLIWLSLLSASYVVGKKSHISITLLSDKLTESKRIIVDILIQSSFLLFGGAVMIYGGLKTVIMTIDQISPALHLSMGLVYSSLPVSGILFAFYSIINILELIQSKETILIDEQNSNKKQVKK